MGRHGGRACEPRFPSEMMGLRMAFAAHRIVATGLCLLAGTGLAYLIVASALDKGISTTDRMIALVIGLAALLVVWRLEFPKGLRKGERSKPIARAQIMNVGFGVFGVVATAIGLMAPRPAVESRPGLIQDTVESTSKDVRGLTDGQAAIAKQLGVGEPSLIRQKISGTWGEPDCLVVRRFDIQDRALKVSTVRVPQGMKAHRWAFTIEAEMNEPRPAGMRSSTMTTTERIGLFPGSSVKFRYLTDDVTERLVWDSENHSQAAPELVRCT